MNICVYCASREKIDKSYLAAGEELGRMLAQNNHTLVFGAGKYGIMGAVARGAYEKGGGIIGVVPRFFDEFDVIFTDCELIRTETMRQRKQLMEDKSDAFIMMPGGIGTLEEFFEILTLKQLRRHKKPIAVYNVNHYYDSMIKMLDVAVENGFLTADCKKLMLVTEDPGEIFEYFNNYKPFEYDKYDFLKTNEE